jgi:hypothetical protein
VLHARAAIRIDPGTQIDAAAPVEKLAFAAAAFSPNSDRPRCGHLRLSHAAEKQRRLFLGEAAIQVVGAIRLAPDDGWAVKRARFITLESVASASDAPNGSFDWAEG